MSESYADFRAFDELNVDDKYYEKEFHKLEEVDDKYYEKDKKEFLKSEKDVLKIFEIDYYLWNKEKQS